MAMFQQYLSSVLESYWTTLTPESALLARVFIEHCVENGADARLEGAKWPVVTAVAFHVQEAYNKLLVILQEHGDLQHDDQEEQQDCFDEDFSKAEAVLGELLRIAARLDYSDEIGRRKVFAIVSKCYYLQSHGPGHISFPGDMLAHEQFPESLIEHCLDVLMRVLPTEREVIRIIVEVILELRDDGSRVNDTKATVRY
jgi:condensin complex subunit 3